MSYSGDMQSRKPLPPGKPTAKCPTVAADHAGLMSPFVSWRGLSGGGLPYGRRNLVHRGGYGCGCGCCGHDRRVSAGAKHREAKALLYDRNDTDYRHGHKPNKVVYDSKRLRCCLCDTEHQQHVNTTASNVPT